MSALEEKRAALGDGLRALERVLVCFSGGVDSAYLLAEAVASLGPARALAFTALSPSLGEEEAALARGLARRLGATHVLEETHELSDARYAKNPVNRCYHCKTEVYGAALRVAELHDIAHVLDGFNVEDRGDHRPGRRAAQERGVRSPLDEHGFGKGDVRDAARAIGLSVWDKPALACLSSRLPYGTEITAERLRTVGRAERALRDLGFSVIRVRYFGERARVELGIEELARLRDPSLRERALRDVAQAGFAHVEFDPEGYRRGSLNRDLPLVRDGE